MSLNKIRNKLVADCSQCDALCCSATEFETPDYKKEAGVTCKNLNEQSLKCQIYDTRELHGYPFCSKFDCHGAGQAVTKLFRDLELNWQDNKAISRIQYDIFIATYHYLSHHFFPDSKVRSKVDQNTAEKLTPFIVKAIDVLENQLNESLRHHINKTKLS